ncbi:MAG: hypothetical protein F4Y02_02370 [Chloroflexi bacterium]|nr:hypothetical protein [Chloroflexota bacterium]
MPTENLNAGRQGLRACFDAVRIRPCRLCGTGPDGVFARCTSRYRELSPLLVVALGPSHEVALASVAWDGAGEVGCVHSTELCLVRPTAVMEGDAETEEVVRAAGGELRIASGFNDPAVKAMICGSAMAIAWQVSGVYPLVESAVLRETTRPRRTLAHPDAPSYGRWPAPWLPWASVSSAVPWSEPPFSEQVQNGTEGLPKDAFAAVGLPPLTIGAHPIAKAMVLAALLRSVPWKGDGTSLGGRLLPPPDPSMAVVGIYRGHVYRVRNNGQCEELFADGADVRTVGVREIELAVAHLRVAEQCDGRQSPAAVDGKAALASQSSQ